MLRAIDMPNIKRAYLTVRGGVWDGTKISLTGRFIVLGRHVDNDVVIKDATVSPRHALVAETPRGFVLRDLDSANGTYVNDGNIGAVEHVLTRGSRIRLGASELTLVFTPEVAGYPIGANALELSNPRARLRGNRGNIVLRFLRVALGYPRL